MANAIAQKNAAAREAERRVIARLRLRCGVNVWDFEAPVGLSYMRSNVKVTGA